MSPSSVPLAGLIVLDGWGLNPRPDGNAVAMARTPVMDALMRDCPHATLVTFPGLDHGQTSRRSDLVLPHLKPFLARAAAGVPA